MRVPHQHQLCLCFLISQVNRPDSPIQNIGVRQARIGFDKDNDGSRGPRFIKLMNAASPQNASGRNCTIKTGARAARVHNP
jgi:hypothetical protein